MACKNFPLTMFRHFPLPFQRGEFVCFPSRFSFKEQRDHAAGRHFCGVRFFFVGLRGHPAASSRAPKNSSFLPKYFAFPGQKFGNSRLVIFVKLPQTSNIKLIRNDYVFFEKV
jgi:hypothetical protein